MKPGVDPSLRPILYVEDEEDDVYFMNLAFAEAGIANPLARASDGQEAIDYLGGTGGFADREKHPLPCLILLDLNLPQKNGMEVLKWIRGKPEVSLLPVIVLTSSLQDQDIYRAYLLGANAYLAKPANPAELAITAKTIKEFWLHHNRTADKPWPNPGDRPTA